MNEGIKEGIRLHNLIHNHVLKVGKPGIYCNHHNTLNLVENHVYHEKMKHIDVRLDIIRDILEEEKFFILKIDTKDNRTYMLTNSLPPEKLKLCLDLVDVCRS